MKIMKQAGDKKDPAWYQKAVKALFQCLTENKHDDCKHHASGLYWYTYACMTVRITLQTG